MLDRKRPYQSLILDILFWHSVVYDHTDVAIGVRDKVMTMDDLRSRTLLSARYVTARFDVAVMLLEREAAAKRKGYPVFTIKHIAAMMNRDHSSLLHLLRGQKNRPNATRRLSKERYNGRSAFQSRRGDPHEPASAGAPAT